MESTNFLFFHFFSFFLSSNANLLLKRTIIHRFRINSLHLNHDKMEKWRIWAILCNTRLNWIDFWCTHTLFTRFSLFLQLFNLIRHYYHSTEEKDQKNGKLLYVIFIVTAFCYYCYWRLLLLIIIAVAVLNNLTIRPEMAKNEINLKFFVKNI